MPHPPWLGISRFAPHRQVKKAAASFLRLNYTHDLNRLNKWQHLEAAKKKLRSTSESKGFERTTERTCLKPLLCTALHSARARKTNRAPEKELHARLLSRRPAFAKTR